MAKPIFNDETLRAKLDRLPQWAQDHVRDLRHKLDAALDSLSVVRPSRTWWGWPHGLTLGKPHGYIPDTEPVRFCLEDDASWVEIRREAGRLNIYGSHGFVVGVQSSNVLHLTVDRKGEWI